MKNKSIVVANTIVLSLGLVMTTNVMAEGELDSESVKQVASEELVEKAVEEIKEESAELAETVNAELGEQASGEEASNKKEATKPSIDDLNTLVESGDYQGAYELGQNMLFDHEGNPDFDLPYGVAALEVGKTSEALFTFERLAEDEPEKPRYQLELGRTLYQLGDNEKAKSTFENVLVKNENLPENVQSQILAYLRAIEEGSNMGNPDKKETLNGFIALSAGWDSNANAATTNDVNFVLKNGQVLTLNSSNKEESTLFRSHQVGVVYVKPITDNYAMNFKLVAQNRFNNDDDLHSLDQSTRMIEFGNRVKFDAGSLNINGRYVGVGIGHESLYNLTQLVVGWDQELSAKYVDRYNVSLSTGTLRYEDKAKSVKDINPSRLDLTLSKVKGRFLHNLNLHTGSDSSQSNFDYTFTDPTSGAVTQFTDVKAKQNSRTYNGLAYTLAYAVNAKTNVFGGANFQTSAYKGIDPQFADANKQYAKRDGNTVGANVGTTYKVDKYLRLKGTVSHLKTDSDLPVYSFSRNMIELGASYQL